jgi:hypothetical protein
MKATYTVRKVRINQGGYESDGTYFGSGLPVYRAVDLATGDYLATTRANDRADAIAKLAPLVEQSRANNGVFYLEGHGWCRPR